MEFWKSSIRLLVFWTNAIQLWSHKMNILWNPKISWNWMKTIEIGTTGNRPSPKRGRGCMWQKVHIWEESLPAAGGASTNCPLPPSLTRLQKGSKFGFFSITYSHLGKYSGKCYNILSRAFLQKSLEFVLPEDPQEPLKLIISRILDNKQST